jgi:hypothetical protein
MAGLPLQLSDRAECGDAGPQLALQYLVLPYEVGQAAGGHDSLVASGKLLEVCDCFHRLHVGQERDCAMAAVPFRDRCDERCG